MYGEMLITNNSQRQRVGKRTKEQTIFRKSNSNSDSKTLKTSNSRNLNYINMVKSICAGICNVVHGSLYCTLTHICTIPSNILLWL